MADALVRVLLTLLILAFLAFRLWERSSRRETVLNVVLGVLILDVALYPGYPGTKGLLQPVILHHSIDLTSLFAVVALLARLSTGRRRVLRASGLLWGVFLLWTLVAALRGLLLHHGLTGVLYEAEVVLHLGAPALLAAGVPVRRLASRTGLPRLAWFAAPLALLGEYGHVLRLSVPGFDVITLGQMGADAATVFASLGLLTLLIALCRGARSRADLLPALVLVAAPLVANQRAALVGLAAAAVAVVLGLISVRGERLLTVGADAALLALGGVVALVALGVFVSTATSGLGGGPSRVSAVDLGQLSSTFTSTAKQQSAQSRLNQWSKALHVAEQAPVLGNGLGTTYVHYEVGAAANISSDITHDVPLDVFLRSGLVGLLLLLGATVASLRDGLAAFWARSSAQVRVLALAQLGVLTGLLVRGSVESVLEKHRLCVLLGVVIGMLGASAQGRFRGSAGSVPVDAAELEHALAGPQPGSADIAGSGRLLRQDATGERRSPPGRGSSEQTQTENNSTIDDRGAAWR